MFILVRRGQVSTRIKISKEKEKSMPPKSDSDVKTPISWNDPNDPRWKEWTDFKGTIFICGHGSYVLGAIPTQPGSDWFKIPKYTSVVFYGSQGYGIKQDKGDGSFIINAEDIIANHGVKGKQLPIDRDIEANKTCPSPTLTPENDSSDIAGSKQALKRNPNAAKCRILNCNKFGKDRLTLKEIVAALPGNEFVWCCCQSYAKSGGDKKKWSEVKGKRDDNDKDSLKREQELQAAMEAATKKQRDEWETIRKRILGANYEKEEIVATVPDAADLKKLAATLGTKGADLIEAVQGASDYYTTLRKTMNGGYESSMNYGYKFSMWAHKEEGHADVNRKQKQAQDKNTLQALLEKLLKLSWDDINKAAALPAFSPYPGLKTMKTKQLKLLASLMWSEQLKQALAFAEKVKDADAKKIFEPAIPIAYKAEKEARELAKKLEEEQSGKSEKDK